MANEFGRSADDFIPAFKELGIDILTSDGTPTESGPAAGALVIDTSNKKLYINTGTAASATWTDLDGVGSTVGTSEIESEAVTPALMSVDAKSHSVCVAVGGFNATEQKFLLASGANITIDNVVLVSDTGTSGSDASNNYTFQVQNLTDAQALLTAAVTTNSNEIGADTVYQITPDQNNSLGQGKVLELQITKTGTPTDLSAAEVIVMVFYSLN